MHIPPNPPPDSKRSLSKEGQTAKKPTQGTSDLTKHIFKRETKDAASHVIKDLSLSDRKALRAVDTASEKLFKKPPLVVLDFTSSDAEILERLNFAKENNMKFKLTLRGTTTEGTREAFNKMIGFFKNPSNHPILEKIEVLHVPHTLASRLDFGHNVVRLQIPGYEMADTNKELLEIIPRCTNLVKLDIPGIDGVEEIQFSNLLILTELNVGLVCADQTLTLNNLPNLRSLKIDDIYTRGKVNFLDKLPNLTNLQVNDISQCVVKPDNFPNLQFLVIDKGNNAAFLSNLANLTDLQIGDISQCAVELSNFQNLQSLTIREIHNKNDADFIKNLSNLTSLEIRNLSNSIITINDFPSLNSLIINYISHSKVNFSENLSSLIHLQLSTISDSIITVNTLPNLRVLTIGTIDETCNVNFPEKFPSLTDLDFCFLNHTIDYGKRIGFMEEIGIDVNAKINLPTDLPNLTSVSFSSDFIHNLPVLQQLQELQKSITKRKTETEK